MGIGAAALTFASSASAVTWTSLLEYRDAGNSNVAQSATPYGTVTIEDGFDATAAHSNGTTLKVTVTLTNPDSLFVNTGGPHEPFLYNTENAAPVTVINALGQNFYDGGRTMPAAFEATPFGDFTNKIGCCSTWVDGQNVVSGFHFETLTTTNQVISGYQISGYQITGYTITGYQQKVDNKGKPVFDNKGNPVYDKSKPIYDYSKPIYNYSKPIYDYSKPIYTTKTTTTKTKVLDYTYVAGHWDENNGSANGIKGPLVFFLHDDAGITFAGVGATFDSVTGKLEDLGTGNHFFSNNAPTGKWWFTADICDASVKGGNPCTYNVAAKDAYRTITTPIPEPAGWALMIAGFGGAGAMLRRRRRLVHA
ncbi:MAG: VPLPA-CTERM sorting domain-containing protein [Caulobacterales bacterium]|nr:VPLPA-CTERM sorting domain-containing protein [Caulobacterales bacterium]